MTGIIIQNKINMLKKILNILISFFFLNLLSSCNIAQNTDNRIESTTSIITMDSIVNLTWEDCEIIETKLTNDTLLIVSTNNFLYYPFGKYHLFAEFQTSHFNINNDKYKIDSVKKDFLIITVENKNNLLRFIESKDSDKLEIVYADIKDNSFAFSNGMKIGMNKEECLSIFFETIPKGLEHIHIIKLESGLTGIWHYYSFSKNKLENVTIKSDYQIDITPT